MNVLRLPWTLAVWWGWRSVRTGKELAGEEGCPGGVGGTGAA